MSNYAKASRIRRESATLVRAPKREPISQSASRLLYVEQGGAMVPWDGSLIPYIHEPMNCLQSRQYDGVVFVGPARTGKTVSLLDAWIMHTAVNDPADMLVVQISEEKAREYSKKRLSRSFESSPEVRAALSPRAHDNNVHDKIFKAGHYLKIGWPSKNIFASSDWKRVALTDYDRMEQDVGGEGSGWVLAGKRTQTFMSSGMVLAESSPGYDILDPMYRPESPHEAPPTKGVLALYNQGDRRLFYWQCPDCGEWFEPDFELLVYDTNESDPTKASREVFLGCPHCGVMHQERQKHHFNREGIWLPQGCWLDQNKQVHGEARVSRIASFWQKGPTAAFQTWNQLVYKYLAAMNDYERTGSLENLKATTNTDQGKPFTPPRNTDRNANDLMDRRSDLGVKVVPDWVRFLTAAIDVQGGKKTPRFEVQVVGWGPELEHIVIDRYALTKSKREDPDTASGYARIDPASYLEDWDVITDKVINKTYQIDDETGRHMPILLTACDSGGEEGVTDNAYNYFRNLKKLGLSRRFMLVKGASRISAPLLKKSYPDNTKRNDRKASAAGDVPVWLLNTDKIKDVVANALGREEPGRRYVHFPDWLPESFFDELSCETRGPDGKWRKPSNSARNEAFDLLVYCWAIIFDRKADRISWDNPPPWAKPIDENSEILTGAGEIAEQPKRRRRRRT
ncbi:TPA: phage terminase large subunit family protein [Vibrio parahaemolyticus]|nr:phage terminase large subunit family protein [Vibrio parahaemolyticus]EJC6855399.1 phage terminase large subunit family protein [Vibrio parahaemolyticus]EKN4540117.1 phage terminase large subunit family protein [Vibrio parahaemolyticus]EKO3542361.1 phage terminase large subunit family protein [Vibrio fluvialis]